ncbi:MAG: GGDEF domain-containing protein [Roseovarius sp.]|nr:GGDEF domain-containing protein [Roseovarius sp.]
MQTEIDRVLVATRKHPSSLACLVISIRDPAPSPDLHDRSATDRIMALCLDRLACILRPQDQIFDLMNGQIGVLVPEIAKPGHAAVLRLSDRLHTTLQAPVSFGSDTIRLSVLIGFCLEDDAPNRSGRAIYESALTALKEVGRDADSGTTARAFASPA